MNKRHISWSEYENLVERLARRITSQISFIYGVPRGGMIPAVMLSHILNVPIIADWELVGNNLPLVVDDIADSGTTIHKYTRYESATIFVNEQNCISYPDYYAEKTSDWIVFPYEKENTVDTISGVLYGS